jgi:hypothetical protein
MKALFTLLLFGFLVQTGTAQEIMPKAIEVGSYIKVNACKKGAVEFESMDVYARTKPYDKSKIDTLTGEGLLDAFFNDKSIDAKRLPCVMGNHSYKIAALQEFEDKGVVKRVILCYTAYPLTLIWIELDRALALNEISVD